MSEYKYISLKDVLKTQSNPKFDTKVESEEELDSHHVSYNMLENKNKFPSDETSPSSLICNNDEEKMVKKKLKKKKKVPAKKRSSCLKHSRSDDPLVYKEFGEGDGGVFSPNQDLRVLCQELNKFSWEERNTYKSKFLSGSEEEDGNEEDGEEEEGNDDY